MDITYKGQFWPVKCIWGGGGRDVRDDILTLQNQKGFFQNKHGKGVGWPQKRTTCAEIYYI